MAENTGCESSDKKKINVLHVIGGGEIGGAEKHVLTLLKNMDRSLFNPMLLCLCSGPFRILAEDNGVQSWEIPMRHKLDYAKIKDVCDFISSHDVHIVHTHGVRANMIARKAASLCHVKIITTFHSMLRYDYRRFYQYWLARILIAPGRNLTNRYIAVSAAVARDMVSLGIPAEEIETIYNALEMENFPSGLDRDDLVSELSLPQDILVVGTVARLHKVKGHIYLVRAAAQLVKEIDNIYFVFVGEGDERDSIQQEIAKLGLEEKIRLIGYKHDAARYCSGFDIFCLPSLMEGMGLSILEAMHYGIPVVATNVGGIGEIITDGKNGLLVLPRDPEALVSGIRSLISDRVLCASLGNAGKKRTEEFKLNTMLARTQQVYLDIIKEEDDQINHV